MVNAQEWLDKKHPKEERSKISVINLTEPSLEGELDLGDFTYWGVKVYIFLAVDETKLIFKNQGKNIMIIKLIKAQEYINQEYSTQEERKKITELDIHWKNLEGDLDLSNFVNLKVLKCSENKLTSLNLSNCSQLEKIDCSDNLLTSLTLPTNPINLKMLDLHNNNFPIQDLSFLSGVTGLESLDLGNNSWRENNSNIYNRFTGSLDYLSGMEKLKSLVISNTDLSEVDINELPKSLEKIKYLTHLRPDCKLITIVSELKRFEEYGRCHQCQQFNTSKRWCQPCADQEWQEDLKNLTGQELIEKFIEKQPTDMRGRKRDLQWIPYKQFTNIEYLAEGGFSKICKAKWGETRKGYNVVLKSLNNSQNITLDFLTEIANTKLVDGGISIVKCYGISQDPETKDYVMVMDYKEDGNLREYLKSKNSKLSLKHKLDKLSDIAKGLKIIHDQNLVHRDLHSGNILNDNKWDSSIADLGLSQSANYQKKEGKIFGVLPYVAPEVLRGQPYTQKSDIYSWGIIAYEFLANSYPYPEMGELELSIKICQGYRPNIDKLKIPQLLRDLIKRCWNADPLKRPSANELSNGFYQGWNNKLQQEYNHFSQNTPYQIHPTAVLTSKVIDTKEITTKLQQMDSGLLDFSIPTQELNELNIQEETSTQTQIEIPPKK